MFNHLIGKTVDLTPDSISIDCNGVGFKVFVTPNTTAALKEGEINKLYISEAIGEDHFDLYGFLTSIEKKYFELLISVSGIGPKAALSILSYNSTDMISASIINNNEFTFTNCPGIGKKTAQRIILELKDKIAKDLDYEIELPKISSLSSNRDDAIAALSTLGYTSSEVIPILKKIDNLESKSTDLIIKEVLKYMV